MSYWYVDNNVGTSGSGTSWATAWKNFSNIVWGSGGVVAGDTVYISGGATSQIYAETLTIGASGTSGSPITIKVGQDSGHNGIVIIDGYFARASGIVATGRNYITIDGEYSGSRHIEIRQHTSHMVMASSNTEFKIKYCSIHDTQDYASIYGLYVIGTHNEVSYCHIYNMADIGTVMGISTGGTWLGAGTAGSYHHNLSENVVDDHIQTNEGMDIYNNVFDQYRLDTPLPPAGKYTDLIHTSSGTHRIYNNEFKISHCHGGGNGMIFLEVFGQLSGGYRTHRGDIEIYNNLFHHTDPNYSTIGEQSVQGIILKWHDDNIDAYGYTHQWDDVQIYNNTFVDHPWVPLSTNSMAADNILTNWKIENNIFLNSNIRSGTSGLAILMQNAIFSASDVVITGNTFAAGVSGGAYISWKGTSYTQATFDAAFGQTNYSCTPTFTSYSPGVESGRDLSLQASDTCAMDRGITQTLFSTDILGTSRPKGSAWDIGAYEYDSGAPETATITVLASSTISKGHK